jgi:hypothetical protein
MDFDCNWDADAAAVAPVEQCAIVITQTVGTALAVDGTGDWDITGRTKGVKPLVVIHGALNGVDVTNGTPPDMIPPDPFRLSVCEPSSG